MCEPVRAYPTAMRGLCQHGLKTERIHRMKTERLLGDKPYAVAAGSCRRARRSGAGGEAACSRRANSACARSR